MFRKLLAFLLIFSILAMFNIAAYAAPISVDGTVYEIEDIMVEGSMLVPFRDIFSVLGADVSWDSVSRSGKATIGDFKVVSAVGERFLVVNGERFDMAVETQIINDKIFVPIRACSEAFRCTVGYDASTGMVVITKGVLPWSLGDVFRGIISAKNWEGVHVALQVGDTVDVGGVPCASITAFSEFGPVGYFAVSYDFAYVFELVDGWYIPFHITR